MYPLRRQPARHFLVALLAGVLLLGGCSQKSAEGSLEAGRAAFERRDFRSAVIEFKNAVAGNSTSAEARYMLGKALLEAGDYRAAEIELRKVKELQPEPPTWAPMLARAMLLTGQSKQLIEEFRTVELPNPSDQVDLEASIAAAWYQRGDAKKASALIERGLIEVPDHPQMLMLKARLLARPGTLDDAIAIVEKLATTHGHDPEVWGLVGDLQLFGKRDLEKAAAAYRKVLEIQAQAVAVHTKLIYVHLAGGRRDAAREQLAAMRKVTGPHPQTALLEAQIAFLDGNSAKARELLRDVLRAVPDHATAHALAGAVELQQRSLLQAETYLNKSLALQPSQPATRKLLAEVLMRLGIPSRALQVLRPSLERGGDPTSFALAGEAHLQQGDLAQAEESFKRAAAMTPADPRVKTALALMQMARGQVDSGLDELRSIAAVAPDTLADLSLANALLRRQRWAEAHKAIDGIEKKQPDKPLAPYLRGLALTAQKDLSGARQAFEKALKSDPSYFAAVAQLAALDIAARKPEDAEKRFEAVLNAEPNHTTALLALAERRRLRGQDSKDVLALIERAVRSNPADPTPHLALVRHWIGQKDTPAALAAAQAATSALPDSPELLEVLGQLQLASGEANQAASTYARLVTKWPTSAPAHVKLAETLMLNKDYAAAERSFRKALELAPELPAAQRGVIAMSMAAKRPQAALEVAKSIQRQRPDDPAGYQFEGDVLADAGNLEAALLAYRRGLGKVKTPGRLPVRIFAALLATKRTAEAERFAVEWATARRGDPRTTVTLASNALNASQLPLAEKLYELAVNADPKHATAVNNLAWVKAHQSKPGAVELADRAVKLAPKEPAYLDTLAYAQAAAGQYEQAVATSKAVLKLAPAEPIYRLNLARIYIKAGRTQEAKAELAELAKLGEKFARHKEVAETLAQLK